ncbi:hypothetical protein SESBI_22459 [Sesbania bispinosa]|nr:hypothetical protein SESBI_22459 [Sesbania bispinosa]
MAQLFRELSLGQSKRETTPPPRIMPPKSPAVVADDLPSPLGQTPLTFIRFRTRPNRYEIFVAACRTSSGKPLSFVPKLVLQTTPTHSHNSPASQVQRSLTSTPPRSRSRGFRRLEIPGSGFQEEPWLRSGQGKPKRPLTVGELMRNQMRVSETMDSRVRRALLRILLARSLHINDLLAANSSSLAIALPLVHCHHFDPMVTHVEMLEDGLSLGCSTELLQQLRHRILLIHKSMKNGRRGPEGSGGWSYDGSLNDSCHWADGIPLNLRLYEMLLQSCFDASDESSIIEEFDELMEQIKKTWGSLD